MSILIEALGMVLLARVYMRYETELVRTVAAYTVLVCALQLAIGAHILAVLASRALAIVLVVPYLGALTAPRWWLFVVGLLWGAGAVLAVAETTVSVHVYFAYGPTEDPQSK